MAWRAQEGSFNHSATHHMGTSVPELLMIGGGGTSRENERDSVLQECIIFRKLEADQHGTHPSQDHESRANTTHSTKALASSGKPERRKWTGSHCIRSPSHKSAINQESPRAK